MPQSRFLVFFVRSRVGLGSLAFILYAAIVVFVLGIRPLWLDEILQVLCTTRGSFGDTLHCVALNRGAAPLPYVIQKAVFQAFGLSRVAARAPAAVCGILGGALYLFLCRRLSWRLALVASMLFLWMPLQFRYSVEARVYSQGLLLTLAVMVFGFRLLEKPGVGGNFVDWDLALFAVAVILGMYTQPFVLFVALGFVLHAVLEKRAPAPLVTGTMVGAICYLPWWIVQRRAQAQPGAMFPTAGFAIAQISPLGILRGLSGGAYVCSVVLIALAGFGAWRSFQSSARIRALVRICGTAILLPVAADAAFNYFYADRQLLFALPALALLAAAGAAHAASQRPRALATGLVLFASAAGWKNYRQAFQSREDWAGIASMIARATSATGCLEAEPPPHLDLYAAFQPALRTRTCEALPGSVRMILVSDPYTSPAERSEAMARFGKRYRLLNRRNEGPFRIDTLGLAPKPL